MLYRRLYTLDSSDQLAAFRTTSSIRASASAKARVLLDRAARTRELAATFYDQRIITELQNYAVELEAEAAMLDPGTRAASRRMATQSGTP